MLVYRPDRSGPAAEQAADAKRVATDRCAEFGL